MCGTLDGPILDLMPHRFQWCDSAGMRIDGQTLEFQSIGKPLVVHASRRDGLSCIKLELGDRQYNTDDGVNDRATAGAAGNQHYLAVFFNDRRRLRTEHP